MDQIFVTVGKFALVAILLGAVVFGIYNYTKDSGEAAYKETRKINIQLQGDVYTGEIIKAYAAQGISVAVYDVDSNQVKEISTLDNGALYEKTNTTYDTYGNLTGIFFAQVDLTN